MLANTQKVPYTSTAPKSCSKSLGKTGKALEAQEVLKKKQACFLSCLHILAALGNEEPELAICFSEGL